MLSNFRYGLYLHCVKNVQEHNNIIYNKLFDVK